MSENNIKNEIFDQIQLLTDQIAIQRDNADLYYRRGRLYWKLGRKGEAISDYEYASAIDADSPATEALRQTREIMDFYNTDLYNP